MDNKNCVMGDLTKENLQITMAKLSGKRAVFHSEADFQLALARQLEDDYECKVRLEYPVYIDCLPWERMNAYHKDKKGNETSLKSNYLIVGDDIKIRRYLDILVLLNGKAYPIELKYKTAAFEYVDKQEGDEYHLADVSAQNLASYDFWKDVYRIEQMRSVIRGFDKGFTIWLTNDLSYTTRNTVNSQYYNFAVSDHKTVKGNLCWRKNINGSFTDVKVDNDKDGRRDYLHIDGPYTVVWNEYSKKEYQDFKGANEFKFAINEIRSVQ